MKNLRYNNIRLRALTILCLMMASVGAWAADYVFTYTAGGTTYYLGMNGTNLQAKTSFDPTCVWTCLVRNNNNEATLDANTRRRLRNKNNTNYFLAASVTRSGYIGNYRYTWNVSAETTGTQYWYMDSNGLYHYDNDYRQGNGYLHASGTTVTINTTSANSFLGYTVNSSSVTQQTSMTYPSISYDRLNGNTGLRFTHTNLSGTYRPAYTLYQFNGGDHYYYDGADHDINPTTTTWTPTYRWSITQGGTYATIDENTGVLTLRGNPTTNQTIRVQLATTNIAPLADQTATYDLTLAAQAEAGTMGNPTISCSGLSGSAGLQLTHTNISGKYVPQHSTFTVGGTTYYYYNGQIYNNTDAFATTIAEGDVSYAWSVTSGNASITNTGVLTLTSDANQTITVRCRATASPNITKDATYTITAANHTAINETTYGDMSITPSSTTLDLGGTSTYTASASISQLTRTRPQYVTITDTNSHSHYKVGTTYQATEPTITETPGAAVNFTQMQWSFSGGNGQYYQPSTTSSQSTTELVLTRNTQKTGTTQTFTITATGLYGGWSGQNKTATATVTIPATQVDLTALHAGAAINLGIGASENVNGHYTYEPNYDSAGSPYLKFKYTSANTSVATVDASGKVTAVGPGQTTITVTAVKLDGTDGVTCNVTVNVAIDAPTISIDGSGNVTITHPVPGVQIRYTTDGTDPTATTGTVYTASFAAGNEQTIKAIAVANGVASAVASEFYATSVVSETKVVINDYEDHTWTYYQKQADLPAGYPTNYLSSPDPRNVKITYRGGSVNNASAVAISGLTGEGQNEMIYYKTLEKTVLGMTGNYPYQVISNPFSKRPRTNGSTGTNGYYGFAGWKVVSGGEYIQEHANNDVLGLDEIIHFTNLDNNYTPNCKSGEIIFEATWTAATVKTGTTAQTFDGGTYETNFWVITGNINGVTVNNACTVTMMSPDGGASANYRNTATISGVVTPGTNNVKVEFVRMNTTTATSAVSYTYTMGRGIISTANDTYTGGDLQGVSSDKASVHTVKIESGKFQSLHNFASSVTNSKAIDQLFILGCDYDRAKGDNSKLSIEGNMYLAQSRNLTRTSGQLYCRTIIKSGNFQSGVDAINSAYAGSGGTQTYYFSVQGDHRPGHRYLVVEGGHLRGIAGGMDEVDAQSTTGRAFTLRVRGTAQIDGVVYGAAEYAGARGTRTMVFTGGTINGWVAAGANGTQTSGGLLNGASYLYMGGNTRVETVAGNRTRVLNRGVGGNVFGAGCGYSASSSSGEVRLGTNVVVADNSFVERGVYGGGSYGFCGGDLTSNIFITGGHVGGAVGGVNGTTYSAAITGGVFGGACQNKGGGANIIMTGGLVEGGLYGGSNANGTMSRSVTMQIDGGQVGTDSKTANIHGGGYGNGTVVSRNVDITLGKTGAARDADGVTVYGDVYGGSALGSVNGTAATNTYHTNVTMNAGYIHGSLYGGALGNAGTAANVYGPVQVKVYGGSVMKTGTDGRNGSGAVYGCNNINGAPQRAVSVDIYGTNSAPAEGEYALYAVYGGGNQASYSYGTPTVTVHGCDNSIEYVYGGGNAADILGAGHGTNVTIWGGNVIGNVFGGGNGTVTAANVAGDANVMIHGGTILNVFGGSNSQGTIGGAINVEVAQAAEAGHDQCPVDIDKLFGGGNLAPSNAGNITIGCADRIGEIYGGANQANITGDIDLKINSGHIDNVFGGNNLSGTISGSIKVTVNDDGSSCGMLVGNVYGGGNLAAYNRGPVVDIQNGHLTGSVFGAGKGDPEDATHAKGMVTGNPQVTIGLPSTGQVTIDGNVFGGGDAANVQGKPVVVVQNCSTVIGTQKDGEGNNVDGTVYGGGNAAHIVGDGNGTDVTIQGGTIYRAFAGGNGEVSPANVAGDAQIVVHGGIIGQLFAGSNMQGEVGGRTSVTIDHENTVCGEKVQEVYGGGNMAAGSAGAVNIECGAIVGDVYGGANQADVDSDITLNITGGTIDRVFGGNNTSGSISGQITVNVDKGSCDLSLGDVFGAGNLAQYTGGPIVNIKNGTVTRNVYGGGKGDPEDHTKGQVTGNPLVTIGDTSKPGSVATVGGDVYGGGDAGNVVGTPQVRVPAKENTTITNVYGGGNAADVNGTDLLIDGGHITGMVFGGGHGSKDDPATPETEPTVAANVKGDVQLYVTGGTINKVFAGSNANGNITGNVDFQIAKGNTSNEMHINEVYGGGNEAAGNAGTILIGCTGSDSEGIGDVYGGANAADINSDITLTITGGRINNVFGGNNTSGDIKGDIEVNIAWDGSCDNSRIGNVYGGGNLATYGTEETPRGPVVNIKNGTISQNVYGGGKGDPADHTKGQITGAPVVNIGDNAEAGWVAHVVGDVYGGGDAGNVVGTPQVNIINKCNTVIDHDVYGGGNAADVSSTDVNIDGGTITGMVFGGGHGDLTTEPQKEANVGGDVHVDITGGTIGKVFGGSNSKGNISGKIYLNINKEDGHCDMHITEVYGGGNLAAGASGNITIGCTGDYETNGEGIGDVYGGANAADINNAIDLTIKGGHINRVFGGNNASGNIAGPITVNVDWDDELTCGKYLGDVFGGGNLANYANATTVNMKKGTVNHIYGGGNEAGVGSATVNMLGGDVLQGLYGGCNTSGTVTGDIAVNVTNGTIGTDAEHEANVHGGGYGSATRTNGNVTVTIAEAAEKTVTIWGDVYGGSALGNVNDASGDLTKVQLDKGTVNGNIYGGGLGSKNGVNGATEDVAAVVNGEVQVVVNGGTVTEKIFGCNNLNGTPKADVTVTINGSDAPATPGAFALSEVYGGGNMADYSPDGGAVCKVVVNNCDTSVGTVYGGGNAADVTSTDVEINGGQIGTVFGGGHGDKDAEPQTEANVSGDVNVKIYGGTIEKVFAGSNSKGTIDGSATLTVNKQGTCDMKITEVYGGGNEAAGNAGTVNIACTGDEANGEGIQDVYGGARMADVTSAITLNITGGNINRVFGGNNISGSISGAIVVNINEDGTNCGMNLNTVYGAGNKANYTGSPVVNIKKGTVKQDVFGGGLQATVTGNTTVNVTGGQVVRDLYGGGALANVEGSTAVNLTGGTVCNAYGGGLGSINGQDGATETVAALVTVNTLVTLDGSIVTGQIFGCNNVNGTPQGHAKVWVKQTVAQPDAADGTYHVLAVYGGGNKAGYYPATDAEYAEVVVENCASSIETVYGGGNAAPAPATQVYIWGGTINEVFAGGNGKGAGNPGADVGYKEDHKTTYGTGTTDAYIYSGVIGGVFGGSNTKGNIREASNVHLDDKSAETGCEFRIGEIYGAGNEAYMDGDSKIDLGCVPRLEVLYGGAKNADMGGNIELNITSGAFGKVFGGNNKGGKIKGSITVNIDETGCYPVEIDELYACGNEAAYSVYGYDSDDNMLTSGAKAYTDPTVNVISCTKIGTVYGGGLGAAAIVYGDPIVNINQIKGKFAGQTHPLRTDESIADALGAIGTVFGGGNAAKVVGSTYVNVGTLAQNAHKQNAAGTIDITPTDAGANITGNVYGGGNQADVTGKTNVTVGNNN